MLSYDNRLCDFHDGFHNIFTFCLMFYRLTICLKAGACAADLCHENGFNDFNVRRDKELLMQERPKSYRKTCKHKNKRINRIIKNKMHMKP